MMNLKKWLSEELLGKDLIKEQIEVFETGYTQ